MPVDVAPLALLVAAVVVVVGAVVMSRLPRERSAVREASASRPVDVTVVAPTACCGTGPMPRRWRKTPSPGRSGASASSAIGIASDRGSRE